MVEKNVADHFPKAKLILGKDVIIEDNVCFYGEVVIGDGCIIQAGAVIGGYGFEFTKSRSDFTKQKGRVVLGNNVEIGVNVCIDRGIYNDTKIGDNVKIANLCHIAHDVSIGENTIIAAKVSVSASATIAKNCQIGAGVTIRDHISIGEETFVGIGSVVMNSIEGKHVILGYPAVKYENKKKILTVDGIAKTYLKNKQRTIDNVSFEIGEKEFVSILGPSGCGKTTLLKVIAGLINYDNGEIKKENNNMRIDMVFQEDALFPWLTVEKNVSLGLDIQKIDKKIIQEKVDWALALVGLKENKNFYPYQLSGGMKKRVSIARCLVLNSSLILMDEPFAALDAITKQTIQKDLRKLQKKEGFSVCMVTHDVEEAIVLSDRILLVGGNPAEIKHEIPNLIPNRESRNSSDFIMMKDMIIKLVEEM